MGHKRRHHNTTGYRQIQNGATRKQVKQMAERLGIKYYKPQVRFPCDHEFIDSHRCLKCGWSLRW